MSQVGKGPDLWTICQTSRWKMTVSIFTVLRNVQLERLFIDSETSSVTVRSAR
ncbi:hypothetical protein INS49_014848 [Diaporthe citri]|uniref:uncharacterized protein n=1 Tax=Diaporthe citri TaxID=83186 RepID=UPI001C816683|nr:uncharacterized protein INS49_014848 [Diaporthe citri]KAG6356972.1 hypothetical protein INS49_014848 [Diaporthe citri]